MSTAQSCINCANCNLSNPEDPKCAEGKKDFRKQLISGEATLCDGWAAAE